MTKTLIERIQMLPFGMLNAFLVIHDGRAILVDTGLPNSEGKVYHALKQHGMGWGDLKLIVLTHGHIDHAGSADRVRELSGAQLVDQTPDASGVRPLLLPFPPSVPKPDPCRCPVNSVSTECSSRPCSG